MFIFTILKAIIIDLLASKMFGLLDRLTAGDPSLKISYSPNCQTRRAMSKAFPQWKRAAKAYHDINSLLDFLDTVG